jgi:hypothetical protein
VQLGTASKEAELISFATGKFIVFPNPAGYSANLSFESEKSGNAEITVTNQLGSVVLRKSIAVQEGINNSKLDVGKLVNGLYYIKLHNGANMQMTKILINK